MNGSLLWSDKTSNTYLKQIQLSFQRHHFRPNKVPNEEFGLLFNNKNK